MWERLTCPVHGTYARARAVRPCEREKAPGVGVTPPGPVQRLTDDRRAVYDLRERRREAGEASERAGADSTAATASLSQSISCSASRK